MCGRYALHSRPEVIALAFGLSEIPASVVPRFNIAPAADVLVVRAGPDGTRVPATLRWGLLPHWAKDPKLAAKLNNARGETVAQKPSFRDAYRRRRCLVPANGFYEWQRVDARKQPYYVHPARGELFAFAGLWERWEGGGGPLETCAIVTTDANAPMQVVHDRMPVIVGVQDYARWLDCSPGADVADLLVPCPSDAIRMYPVSTAVNRASNDLPELIQPLEQA
ncbi:MAG: SOS response-associated peptidase [Betaproteobacteria bacterium]|nr:SOS response-associated peptidase [Betaproteobacteria bacterium]